MDDDYEMAVNPNQMMSGKSLTAKHANNNDVTLLNHNTLNAASKCNSKSTIMLPTSISSTTSHSSCSNSSTTINNPNIMLSSGNTNFAAIASMPTSQLHSNDALHTRLTFTSPKLVNSRSAAIETNIAIDCFESDTVDSSIIKEEPMSPDSSCPPSPTESASTSTANILDGSTGHIIVTQPAQQNGASSQFGTINVNLANVATYTNTDLVFEHNKVSCGQRFAVIRANSELTLMFHVLRSFSEWFVAVVASFTQPLEEPANHSKWYTTKDRRTKT